jgi:hypothetical protein
MIYFFNKENLFTYKVLSLAFMKVRKVLIWSIALHNFLLRVSLDLLYQMLSIFYKVFIKFYNLF